MPRTDHFTDLRATDATDPRAAAAALAEWMAAEPLPALRHYRRELAELAAQGQPETGPVADRLLEVIATLNEIESALRANDGTGLPADLSAVLARCTEDIRGAQTAVATSRRLVQDAGRTPR